MSKEFFIMNLEHRVSIKSKTNDWLLSLSPLVSVINLGKFTIKYSTEGEVVGGRKVLPEVLGRDKR